MRSKPPSRRSAPGCRPPGRRRRGAGSRGRRGRAGPRPPVAAKVGADAVEVQRLPGDDHRAGVDDRGGARVGRRARARGPRPWPPIRRGVAVVEVGGRQVVGDPQHREPRRSGRSRPWSAGWRVPSGSTTVIDRGPGDRPRRGHDDAAGLGHQPGGRPRCPSAGRSAGPRSRGGPAPPWRRWRRPRPPGRPRARWSGTPVREASPGVVPAPSWSVPLVVAMTSPAATRATTTQAVAPPTIQGRRSVAGSVGRRSARAGDGRARPDATDSEGWRHRRSSGGIHPRSPPPSASSPQSSPGSRPDAPWSSPSTGLRLLTTAPMGRRLGRPATRRRPVRPLHPGRRHGGPTMTAWLGTWRSISGRPTPSSTPRAGASC